MSLKIVIEGADGSGKQTQAELLHQYLKDKSIKVSFPNYSNISSMGIKYYLETGLPDLKNEKSLMDFYKYIASLYTVNRYETFNTPYENHYETLLELINNKPDDFIFIFDRYTTSNMLHMGSNFEDKQEQEEFLEWLLDLEYSIYKIPKPDIVFYLSVPTMTSLYNIEKRKMLSATDSNKDKKKDIHESLNHLTKVNEFKNYLIQKHEWVEINCTNENGQMLSMEEINQKIIDKINELTNLSI